MTGKAPCVSHTYVSHVYLIGRLACPRSDAARRRPAATTRRTTAVGPSAEHAVPEADSTGQPSAGARAVRTGRRAWAASSPSGRNRMRYISGATTRSMTVSTAGVLRARVEQPPHLVGLGGDTVLDAHPPVDRRSAEGRAHPDHAGQFGDPQFRAAHMVRVRCGAAGAAQDRSGSGAARRGGEPVGDGSPEGVRPVPAETVTTGVSASCPVTSGATRRRLRATPHPAAAVKASNTRRSSPASGCHCTARVKAPAVGSSTASTVPSSACAPATSPAPRRSTAWWW